MRIGLCKTDITPPVGCELAGYGHYLRRHSTAVLDPLYATALAAEDNGSSAILISCDLLLVTAQQTAKVRAWVSRATGVAADRIMVCCTHTHSGPATGGYRSLGEAHLPYVENLPCRVGQAAVCAHANMREAALHYAEVPCEAVAYNRWLNPAPDRDEPDEATRLRKLEGPVDRTAHVIKFVAGEQMVGFLSYYSVHPVACGNQTKLIHGDLVGLATNTIEKEHAGAVGLFVPGACGDINPIYYANDQDTAVKDLRLLSDRYSDTIRTGLAEAQPLETAGVRVAQRIIQVPYTDSDRTTIEQRIRDIEEWLRSEEAEQDQRHKCGRVADLEGYRRALELLASLDVPQRQVEVQAIRLGGVTLVSAPFELYNDIKQQIQSQLAPQLVLPVGYANDYLGYAVTTPPNADAKQKKRAADYAAWHAWLIGEPPLSADLDRRLLDEMCTAARQVAAA